MYFLCVYALDIAIRSNKKNMNANMLLYTNTDLIDTVAKKMRDDMIQGNYLQQDAFDGLGTLTDTKLIEQISAITIVKLQQFFGDYLLFKLSSVNFRLNKHVTYLVQRNNPRKKTNLKTFIEYIEIEPNFFGYYLAIVCEAIFASYDCETLINALSIYNNCKIDASEFAKFDSVLDFELPYFTKDMTMVQQRIEANQTVNVHLFIDISHIIYLVYVNNTVYTTDHRTKTGKKYVKSHNKALDATLLSELALFKEKLQSERDRVIIQTKCDDTYLQDIHFMALKVGFAEDNYTKIKAEMLDTYNYIKRLLNE